MNWKRPALAPVLMLVAIVTIVAFALIPIEVSGEVRTGTTPISGAVVRQRATENTTITDENGRFELRLQGFPLHKTVTAWAEGYYIAAADVSLLRREGELILRPHTATDHPDMAWLPSDADPDVELACGNCHGDMHQDWRDDAHSQAAINPLVQAMYLGTDDSGRAGVGPGFLLDEPDEPGNCAFCHAPAAARLDVLEGEAANGVFCQFCHSIAHAQQPYAETTAGVQAISLLRPPPGEHLFIGPYDDVPGRDTYSALQKSSQFCAACHSGSWWNVPTYTSFDEWQASPYAEAGEQCQDCHMAATVADDDPPIQLVSACAPGEPSPLFGETLCKLQSCIDCHITGNVDSPDPTTAIPLIPARQPDTISSHLMRGSRHEDFLGEAVDVAVRAQQGKDGVLVEVDVSNVGAGHHIPTDGWMRNMILLVSATDQAGNELPLVNRQVVPDWGGVGDVTGGNYAGVPGKGFARVLEDWEGESPAPPWRNGVRVLNDTRIPALATDTSTYAFAPASADEPVMIKARLIYRRSFKVWADAKGWDLPDMVIAEAETAAAVQSMAVLAGLQPVYDTTLFAPSAATTTSGERIAEHVFRSPESCGECHQVELGQWLDSGHALATSSPLYKARFKVANEDSDGEVNAYCAGCHTPIGLFNGQIRSRWGWTGQESYPLGEVSLRGITCDVCHSIVDMTGSSDGAYVIDQSLVLDTEDPTADPHPTADLRPHIADLLTKPEFCGTCHEAISPVSDLAVMTTFSEWQASPYNATDPATRRTCQDCHFAEDGHGQVDAADLLDVASVEILHPESVQVGEELPMQVRVSNLGAGHHLPTGATELRTMWLALSVVDAGGQVIYTTGGIDAYGDPLAGSVLYGTTWLDAEGEPTTRLWEAATVDVDHRIPAGESVLESLPFTVPDDAVSPLTVTATLRYRAASGYLSSLMSIYLQEEVADAPTLDMATDVIEIAF
ncbi:MAG: hypothetical protein GY759_10530 [Chloroflexi bacterium]|nr:hypothetical protein [Chloroflexota bacterium]